MTFLERWHAGNRRALAEALAYLASCRASPEPDGVLDEWVTQLATFRFDGELVAPVVTLLGRDDPHLQLAGVRLARAVLRDVGASPIARPGVAEPRDRPNDPRRSIETAIAQLVDRPVDPWVLAAVVELLRAAPSFEPFTEVYQSLARHHRSVPSGPGRIIRAAWIDPWADLEQLYCQRAIATMTPGPRELAFLGILERQFGTRGWEATVSTILRAMGFDPDEHFQRLHGAAYVGTNDDRDPEDSY